VPSNIQFSCGNYTIDSVPFTFVLMSRVLFSTNACHICSTYLRHALHALFIGQNAKAVRSFGMWRVFFVCGSFGVLATSVCLRALDIRLTTLVLK